MNLRCKKKKKKKKKKGDNEFTEAPGFSGLPTKQDNKTPSADGIS
jgi:hypothetical protein